jgi:hypothetical protein
METSVESDFVFNIHKILLSFAYLKRNHQKMVLLDIRSFIQRLSFIFKSNKNLKKEEKRLKILEVFVKYLDRLYHHQILHYIQTPNKEFFRQNIEKEAYKSTQQHLYKAVQKEKQSQSEIETQTEVEVEVEEEETETEIQQEIEIETESENNRIQIQERSIDYEEMERKLHLQHKKLEKIFMDKIMECKRGISFVDREMDRKIQMKTKNNFLELENEIKNMLRESLTKILQMENECSERLNTTIDEKRDELEKKIVKKMDEQMETSFQELYGYLNTSFQDSLKGIKNMEDNIHTRLDERIEEYIQDINERLKDNFRIMLEKTEEMKQIRNEIRQEQQRQQTDISNTLHQEFESKLKLLSTLFQTNLQEVVQKLNQRIIQSSDVGTFHLQYHPEKNEISLYQNERKISSIQINHLENRRVERGESGKTPKIKRILFRNQKVIFIIEGEHGDYEVESQDDIPTGPRGEKGEKGDPGTVYSEFGIQQQSIMRVDPQNLNNLVLLKSLCIGERSHCFSDNSLSIGGGINYKSNSLSIGNHSSNANENSISLYGNTIGKNSFSYRANNVNENQVVFGNQQNDIDMIKLHSKKIVIDTDEIEFRGRNHLRNLEERLTQLERKINTRF